MDNIVSNSSQRDNNADHANSHSHQDSTSPANASQAVILSEIEAAATNTAHEQQTPAASPSENASTKSDEVDKTGAKRKAKTQRISPLEKKLRDYEQSHFDEFLREFEAEEARRAALSLEARKEEDIKIERKMLEDHIKPRFLTDMFGLPIALDRYVLFILQSAPGSNNGSTCRFEHCTNRILPGQYRIALSPGMNDPRGPDFYHVGCFENLLDMSSSHHVARFDADRRRYIPDQGAQLILEEYITRWKLRLRQTQSHEKRRSSPIEKDLRGDENLNNRLQSHPSTEETGTSTLLGSSVVTTNESEEAAAEKDKWEIADEMYEKTRRAEVKYTRQSLNRFRYLYGNTANSDGETSEWDVNKYFLPETDPEYSERHTLSQALKLWEHDV